MKKIKKRSFSSQFWSQRYQENRTGWDIGEISSPLKHYIDHLENHQLKILIPGAGNAYEAQYLFEKGFKNVFVADISETPLKNLKSRFPDFPKNQILHLDFFEIEDTFDLIFEQTFFCALPVASRLDYAKKSAELLKENGLQIGLLFSFPLTGKGPPFGGSKEEYLTYFSPYFEIEILEPCYNSIPPRQGNELFFKFKKKPVNSGEKH
ncbi:thiopurine S-methyltransferase [Salegentibacter sp. 24]|uniref:methyltransferase domain-containing protein n=1 Tax=Salegentibacter sp. 24 TaxID=2183986 RepID=UPI00105D6EFA|nr:methyltransferase domain-containing protein [Salegentibacter sp. 24]TDN84699.1 thiopurine S-methyltransferase [Salegentibacter sp. 24]